MKVTSIRKEKTKDKKQRRIIVSMTEKEAYSVAGLLQNIPERGKVVWDLYSNICYELSKEDIVTITAQ